MKNLIQSECRLVDNNLLHSDRLAAYEAASDLLENMQDTQEEQISKRIEKKFPGNDSRTQSGTREPRTGNGRSRRQIVDDDSNFPLNDQEEQMKSLMTKANFDRKTFLFGLGIVQNRVTDIKNASVRELQALRDGLTVKAITGM